MGVPFLDPVTLSGDMVTLEPLTPGHAGPLRDATLDGRDSAQYSITDDQWPAVERHLTFRLASRDR